MRPIDPFAGRTLPGLLLARAAASPQAPFLSWAPFDGEGVRWTYREFAEDVSRVAGGLSARGVARGQRVLVLAENCPEVLLAYFACAWLGAVCVPVNAATTSAELASFLERTRAVGCITQPHLLAVVEGCERRASWTVVVGGQAGRAFDSLRGAEVEPAPVPSSAPVSILFTSGTTARPKGVVWTHANVLWAARMGAMNEGLTERDTHLVFLPLFHVVALTWSILPTIWAGGSAVLQPRFSAQRFWDTALAHRCTWASMVPFCTAVLAKQPVPPEHSFRCWGHAVYSAEYEQLFHTRLLGWWGMTEIVTQGVVGDALLPQVPGTIGRPAPGYDVAVVDERGVAAPDGEPGELRIRGERGVSIFLEYLDDPEATREAFDSAGYFRTGDRVVRRADGAIQFVDRFKDVIKVGGENVAAPEVERVIAGVPGVRDVAVVARRDPVLGEVPIAFVVLDAGVDSAAIPEAVLAACRRVLAKFKVPREVRVLEDFPRVSIGKVSKAELRRLAS